MTTLLWIFFWNVLMNLIENAFAMKNSAWYLLFDESPLISFFNSRQLGRFAIIFGYASNRSHNRWTIAPQSYNLGGGKPKRKQTHSNGFRVTWLGCTDMTFRWTARKLSPEKAQAKKQLQKKYFFWTHLVSAMSVVMIHDFRETNIRQPFFFVLFFNLRVEVEFRKTRFPFWGDTRPSWPTCYFAAFEKGAK